MRKTFLLVVFIFINAICYSQSTSIFSKAHTDINKARGLSIEEKHNEALVLLKIIKNKLIKTNKLKELQGLSDYSSAIILESEIYLDIEDYDKAIETVKNFRQDILSKYDLKYLEILNIYYMVIVQESTAYYVAERYDEALGIIKPFRLKLVTDYNIKNMKLFSIYSLIVTQERLIYMHKDDLKALFKFENDQANHIKPLMKGNNDLTDFYFETKQSSIKNSIPLTNPPKEQLSNAIEKIQKLLTEIKKAPFQDGENKKEFIESIVDDYFGYKYKLSNPHTQGDYDPSIKTLKAAKSDIETLLVELQSNNLINNEDRIERHEEMTEMIVDLTDRYKSKEKEKGKYQDYLAYHKEKKKTKAIKKDEDYFNNKLDDIDELSATAMYHQQIQSLDEFILELNNSDLKQSDLTNYIWLNYTAYMIYYTTYFYLKDVKKSIANLDKSINFYKKLPKEDFNEVVLKSYDVIYASLYFYNKQYDKALEYTFKYLETPTDYSRGMYSFVGNVYFEMKKYKKAVKWHKKHLAFLSEKKTKEIGESTIPLANYSLGKSYLAANMLDNALELLSLSLKYFKKENTPDYLNYFITSTYADLGILYHKKGMLKESNLYMAKFSESLRLSYFETLLSSTETDRAFNISQEPYGPNDLFYYLSQRSNSKDKLVSYGYDYALLSKQMLLNTSETIRKNASINDILQLKEINNKWEAIKDKLKEVDVKNKDSLMDYARVYEKELITRGKKSILQLFENSKIGWNDVKANLKHGEAAIEFISFNPYKFDNNSNQVYYGAFILKKDSEFPVFINLFKEDELKKIVSPIVDQELFTKIEVSQLYESNGKELYRLIWFPLEENLKGVNKVYFSPTGILHDFSFTALPTENSSRTLGEKYRLVQLGSTKNIVNSKMVYNYKKALLFGDITYNYNANKIQISDNGNSKRNNRGSDFTVLPGTRTEINEIEKILLANNIKSQTYTKSNATEGNLISSINDAPEILHIGTHAFYLKPIAEDFFMTDMIGFAKLKGDKNPMNRSGLALAEANYFWKFGDKISMNEEDGILTANEISTLNLNKIDLAVLSACETALGQSSNNEGVFGLQRGLKMAGVKNLLLSLWKVDDNVTQEYMVDFYSNLINKKMSIQEAYFETQNTIKSKYPNPYYWAAFVLIR